jgi:hypothetical protein
MAWSRSIEHKCVRCGGRAKREVLNSRNASHGYFCTGCARLEVKRLDREEKGADLALRDLRHWYMSQHYDGRIPKRIRDGYPPEVIDEAINRLGIKHAR